MRLSQTTIKAYTAEHQPGGCMWRFKLRFIDGIQPDDDGKWNALKKGILFERLVLGESRFNDPLDIPKMKDGTPTQVEKDIMMLADNARQVIDDLAIGITAKQLDLTTKDRTGHPDALIQFDGHDALMDLKYTETEPDDRWRGWGEVELMDHTQALDYVDLYHEVHGVWMKFYYLVFGKSGWCRMIQVKITPETMATHQERVKYILNELKTENYTPTTSFNTCAGCELVTKCRKAVKVPVLEEISI